MNIDTPKKNIDNHQVLKKKENALESKSRKSFFSQLKNFCSSLQNQYEDIESQFKLPPGSNPRHYDKGLKALNLEVSNIKKLAEDTSENVNKIQQFSYFVESTKDLVNAQKEDLKQMENFLMRYGYVPPEVVEISYDTAGDEKHLISSDEEVENIPPKSPELSEVGRRIIEGKSLPIFSKPSSNVMEELLNTSEEKVVKTPIQQNNSKWYMTPTPGESSRRRVEKWIESVEAEAVSLTPVCKNIKNAFEAEENSEFLKYGIQNEHRSPEEPVMSSVNVRKLKDTVSTTPEDPTISVIDYAKRGNQFQDTTPEEPNLSQPKKQNLQDTPEEPNLSQPKKQNLQDTPEEPNLSQPKKQNLQDTPEEPILLSVSKQKGEKTNLTSRSAVCESVSPQLTDITLKVLNLRQMRPPKYGEMNTPLGNYSKLENLEPESPKLSDVTLKLLHKT